MFQPHFLVELEWNRVRLGHKPCNAVFSISKNSFKEHGDDEFDFAFNARIDSFIETMQSFGYETLCSNSTSLTMQRKVV